MKKIFDFSFSDLEKLSSLNHLREQLLNILIFCSLVIGTILFALAVIPAIQKGVYLSILAYILVYIWLVVITFGRRLPYSLRVYCWLCLFYVLGVVNLAMNGFNVDAGLFFLSLIAMAALFAGLRTGLIALSISGLSIAVSGAIIVSENIQLSMNLPQTDKMLWIIGGAIFMLMGVFLIVSLTTLVRGLDSNLTKATSLAYDLAQANETLEKSEKRFRSLIEGSSDVIALVSQDGTVLYASSPVERILGYKVEELIGQNIFKFLHPEDLPVAVAALSPGTPAQAIGPFIEVRIRHNNGSWRYLEVQGRELLTDPVINGTIVNCRDITDRKEMEENLRKSQLLLEKTFSSLSDALFLIDAKTLRIIDCNQAASRIYGYSREEILGQTTEFICLDPSAFAEFRQHFDQGTVDGSLPGRFESRMRQKDGRVFPAECSVAPLIDKQNGHIGWVGLVRDITVRKNAEQLLLKANEELEQRVFERTAEVQRTSKQFRELVAHSPAVIYSADLAGDFGITFVTENVASLTGYESSQFTGDARFWRSLIHPEDVPQVLKEIKIVKASGGAVLEYRFLNKAGIYRWVRDEMRLVKDPDGALREFVGSWFDITDQKIAEHALRESEEINRVLLDSTDASISLIDPDGVVLSMNEAGAALLGLTVKDIVGKCVFDLFPPDVAKSRRAQIDKVYKTGRPAHYEDYREGHWFDNNVYPVFNAKGKVTRIVTHAYDITESKRIQESLHQSEERYRTLADASPDLIFIIGRDDRVQYINSFASIFLNLPINKVIGQTRGRFFSEKTSKHQRENIMRVLREGKSTYSEDKTDLGDRSIWLGTWLVPLREASGNVSAVLGVSRDISDQKQAEEEILRSRDLLEERVKERTAELIASHTQLRQLTSQLVTAQEEERRSISRELHDEAGQALISLKYSLASAVNEVPESHASARQRLADAIAISDQMMTQIRTLARSLRPPVLEIGGINLSLKVYCEEITERTGLSIHYQGEEIPNLPDDIGISLYRFVQETLTNTLKHAYASKVAIRLQYRKKQINLSVSDNGRGLRDNIQSDGIGILGMEERFNLFGGSIKISSRKGRGVKVTATVPWPKSIEEEQE
jgi:PAS domain S-box-containing protein